MNRIKKAFVEITNVCNLSCDFCHGTSRPQAFLTQQGFARVLERLAGNVQCLYFHVMGEPLLHPLIGLFLDMAHEAGLPVNLTTNGTLLASFGEALLQKPALRLVSISLHSQVASGMAGDYLEDVLAFARKARSAGETLVALRLWNLRKGAEDAETERALGRIALEYGLKREALDDRGDGRGAKLAEGIYLNRSPQFSWPDMSAEDVGGKGYCMGLKDQIGILCGGDVVPCCLDSEGTLVLGNIYQQSLAEILTSPRSAAIAKGFARREVAEELCRHCGYRKRFDNA